MQRLFFHLRLSAFICGFFLFFSSGCNRQKTQIILYTSVDEPYARPIVEEFEKQTGIDVLLVTDAEASKSVGLAERLRAEKDNPQADVWWGNEPFYTIGLAQDGLFDAYDSPAAADVNAMYKDPQHLWAGNGLRARVMAAAQKSPVNIEGLQDLVNPKLKGKIAMAMPTAGTAGGAVTALYVVWGDQRADSFFRALHNNEIHLLGGNAVVAEAVGSGTMWAGITDNDDYAEEANNGGKLSEVIPDQDTIGTLMIPTCVGLVHGGKHADASKKLIDYLLSPQVERKMMEQKFCNWSVRNENNIKAMQIDYNEVAKRLPQTLRRATAILEGRKEG